MGWFKRFEERLSGFAHEVEHEIVVIGGEVVQAAKDVFHAGEAAVTAVVQNVPEIAVKTLKDTYDQLLGNDLKTLRDPHAGFLSKVDAALDLATTFTLPAEKIPVMVGEAALKNLIHEGETTAIAAAMKSLQASGDTRALIGVEAALLAADPATGKMLTDAGLDTTQASKTLGAIRDAVTAGKDLPTSATTAIGDLATAFAGPGSFKDRLAALHTALGTLTTVANDIETLETGAKTLANPTTAATPAAPAAPAVTQEHGLTVVTTRETILALQDGTALTPAVIDELKAERAAHPDKKLFVVGKDLDAASTAELKAAGIEVAGARQIATALGSSSTAPAPAAATALGDADLVRETLAKISPETADRIRRSGRAEVGMPHPEATPWDGKSQIGSVTSVIGARVEQYVGKSWTTYTAAQLAPLQAQLSANEAAGDPTLLTKISPGDELRVGANGSIELIPHDPQQPDLKAVAVEPGGASRNIEPATLQRH